jgi:hypothetical protein
MAKTDSTTVTTTVACDMGRHPSCRSVVLSLTDAHLSDCACPCHSPEPAPVDPEEEDGGLDLYVDLMVERDLEDAHFAEGWS